MSIRGIIVLEDCPLCKGAKRSPGGQREYGETVPCGYCEARGTQQAVLTIDAFFDFLEREGLKRQMDLMDRVKEKK